MTTMYRRHLMSQQTPTLTRGSRKTCPPCTQECEQGKFCPARLAKAAEMAEAEARATAARAAEAQRRVREDARHSDVPTYWMLLLVVLVPLLSALVFRLLHMTGIPG